MSIQDKLERWAKTPNGKAKIDKARRAAIKHGKQLGTRKGGSGAGYGAGTGSVAAKDLDFYKNEFLRILRGAIEDIPTYYDDAYLKNTYHFADDGNIHCDGTFNEATGFYEFHFNFDPESIKRESLDPDEFPGGAYDIVALINHGYDADGSVYGYWAPAGKAIKSLQSREGAFFIQAAVEEFERLYGNVAKISYNEKYDKRS